MRHLFPLSQAPRHRDGFSLVQVSLMIVIASVILVSVLPGGQTSSDSAKERITLQRMQKIEEATRAFMAKNYRRPCPADGALAQDNVDFGIEATVAGDCFAAGAIRASFSDGNIVAGAVPTKTLNLPDDYVVDAYGRRFIYMADKRATAVRACHDLQSQGSKGGILIKADDSDITATDYVMWALLSYGKDGHGAFPIQGSSVANRNNTGTANVNTLNNAFVEADFTLDFTNTLIRRERETGFDDYVWYLETSKNTCCLGNACNFGFYTEGTGPTANWGQIAVGDLNGDTIPDMIVPMQVDTEINPPDPAIYVVFGKKTGWEVVPGEAAAAPLNTLVQGNGGFSITLPNGTPDDYIAGITIATGDLDGDSIDDLVISTALDTDDDGLISPYQQFWVVRGQKTLSGTYDIGLFDGTDGFIFMSNLTTPGALAIGNFDGAGPKDLFVVTENSQGYLLLGAADLSVDAQWTGCNWDPDPINLCYITDAPHHDADISSADPNTDFSIDGTGFGENHVVGAGDVNNDGRDDIVLRGNMNAGGLMYGSAYVLFGRAAWAATVDLVTNLGNPATAARFHSTSYGAGSHLQFALAVAVADINSDGISDLLFNSMDQNVEAYYGVSGVWASASIDLAANSSFIVDHATNAPLGDPNNTDITSLAVGDVNGDNLPDLIFGNTGFDNDSGRVFVLLQSAPDAPDVTPWRNGNTLPLFDSLDGTFGFAIEAYEAGDLTGVVSAADINKDGKTDLLIGAPGYPIISTPAQGGIFVFYGRKVLPWEPVIYINKLIP